MERCTSGVSASGGFLVLGIECSARNAGLLPGSPHTNGARVGHWVLAWIAAGGYQSKSDQVNGRRCCPRLSGRPSTAHLNTLQQSTPGRDLERRA